MRETVEIPLCKIYADRKWNGRKLLGDDESGAPNEHGFDELVTSLEHKGQDDAIIVRPVSPLKVYAQGYAHFEFKYELIAGFRRYFAASRLKEFGKTILNVAPGHIRAEVRVLDDFEARALNGRENISRENLTAADSAYLVAELVKLKPTLKDAAVARELGFVEWYVTMLRRTYRGLSELTYETPTSRTTCFEYWREHPSVGLQRMFELVSAKADARTKERQFVELVSGGRRPPRGELRKSGGRTQSSLFGQRLGKLERDGCIHVVSSEWKKMLVFAGLFGMNTADDVLERAAEETRAAYEEAKNGKRT